MMVLVTGGASSGKSAYAEQLALGFPGPHFYLATMKPYGEEAARRIERHRSLRAGKGFVTVECHEGLEVAARALRDEAAAGDGGGTAAAGAGGGTALLECLGNAVANELFSDDGACAGADDALAAVLDGADELARSLDCLVIVGNEVGGDGVFYEGDTRTYQRVVGAAACALAQRCDAVVECIAGQPMFVKGTVSP